MKKCPTCEKTFDDNMKFCQSDGTPLVEVQETPAEPQDPYKTTVGKVDDLPIPAAADPFETMVAATVIDESDDKEEILELEEEKEIDPMQTMVSGYVPEMKSSEPEPESEDAPPPTPFGNASSESEKAVSESVKEEPITPAPAPPKFSEPDLSPPNLADASGKLPESPVSSATDNKSESSEAEPFEAEDEMPVPESVAPPTSENVAPPTSDGSEFNQEQKRNPPIPSPFDLSMPPKYIPPTTPMPPYKDEEIKAEALNTPFAEEVHGNQQIEQSGWSPPSPANQGMGENMQFQNPAGGVEGEDKTLPIVSLICGILSLVCGFGLVTGIPAIITGYMARKNISESPSQYGGGTMALIGMVLGVAGTILITAFTVLYVILVIMAS